MTFVFGMLTACAGVLVQWFAPIPDFSYIEESGGIVGATGGFSQIWYLGRLAFYLGLLVAAIGLTFHAFTGGRRLEQGVRQTGTTNPASHRHP